MELLLQEIPAEGLALDFELEPEQLEFSQEGFDFEGAIRVQLSVLKHGQSVFINGQLEGSMRLECNRCLKRSPFSLSTGIHAEYLSASLLNNKTEHELKPDEMDVIFYQGDRLRFGELIREQILLSVPMHHLCGPDCRGLCQQCGQDLNVGVCGCPEPGGDPRFSALRSYFQNTRRR